MPKKDKQSLATSQKGTAKETGKSEQENRGTEKWLLRIKPAAVAIEEASLLCRIFTEDIQ